MKRREISEQQGKLAMKPKKAGMQAKPRKTPLHGAASALTPSRQLDTCSVNSRHHQAVARVAPSFVVSAVSSDGIVEAIERPESTFCVGVQWHPENFWRTGEFDGLFEAFVEAARQRRGNEVGRR